MIYSESQPGSENVREYPYQRVLADLRTKIIDGDYPAGTKLPSRPNLRATYEVSDTALDRVMWELRREGLVEVQHGVGVFVVDRTATAPDQPTPGE